jgi:DNA-binding MarR family transcriptional regulator
MPDAPEQPRPRGTLLLDVFVLGQLAGDLLDRALAERGASPDGFAVHSVIGALGPLTPTQLAAWLGMPLTTVSDYLRRLDERGHLERLPNPDDGRSQLVTLTPEGRTALDQALPALRETVRLIEEHLRRPPEEIRAAFAELERALREIVSRRTTPKP